MFVMEENVKHRGEFGVRQGLGRDRIRYPCKTLIDRHDCLG